MHNTKRPCAVHSIDHFMLAVPDLEQARHFFDAFGLATEMSADQLLLRAADSAHVWASLVAGTHKHLVSLTFNCYAEDYEALVARIGTMAAAALPPSEARYRDGCWFKDFDGNLLQVRIGQKTTIDEKLTPPALLRSADRGVAGRHSVAQVKPDRLSHVLLFATDVARQVAFYRNVLGLRLSDQSADIIAFLHAPHGCDHHLIAFAKSTARGWHHSSWDVPGMEDVGLGWMQMQQAGYVNVWGPGRHVLGSNYFCYVEDPWGSFCEFSADMDYVKSGHTWPSGDYPPEDSLYLWGPPPPANFVVNHEAP